MRANILILVAAVELAACAGSPAGAPAAAVTLNRHEHPEQGDAPTAVPRSDDAGAIFRGGQFR